MTQRAGDGRYGSTKTTPIRCMWIESGITANAKPFGGGVKHYSCEPDIIADFTDLPFEDNSFYLVVFDPPHLITGVETAWLSKLYGRLPDDWRDVIRKGFEECWRVLKPNGTLIFKWNEVQIPTREVIKAIGHDPLFGHRSGKKSQTHWITFFKNEEDNT